MSIVTSRATPSDLDALSPLFDAYRVFYGRPSDPDRAHAFLRERMLRAESAVFIARDGAAAVGFTQLFPLFSSVSAARIWLLNDLFVVAHARRRGIARVLLHAAEDFARDDGALRLELETGRDNAEAQALYHAVGWLPEDGTLRFHRVLSRR